MVLLADVALYSKRTSSTVVIAFGDFFEWNCQHFGFQQNQLPSQSIELEKRWKQKQLEEYTSQAAKCYSGIILCLISLLSEG